MQIVVLVVLMALGLIAAALVRNQVPLTAAPGPAKRLKAYLSRNMAETRRDHPFPELELPCPAQPPEVLWERLERAVARLGWQMMEADPGERRLRAVVTTPLWRFKDDLEVRLIPASCGTEIHIRSSSRVGRGDLGANSRHILDLLTALEQAG
ncbi:MAG: DUF1499 domain-containing protein [Candidatus Competibacteraceae bacterium]|nr:DUF1499 domain-containing protein [Candidatus Competibacteraceae bacterium]